jgi:hypothetical protein
MQCCWSVGKPRHRSDLQARGSLTKRARGVPDLRMSEQQLLVRQTALAKKEGRELGL